MIQKELYGKVWTLLIENCTVIPPSSIFFYIRWSCILDLLTLQEIWWVLLCGNPYSTLLLVSRCLARSPPPPPSPPPALGLSMSLSLPWTILTCSTANCLCSAFELGRFVVVSSKSTLRLIRNTVETAEQILVNI